MTMTPATETFIENLKQTLPMYPFNPAFYEQFEKLPPSDQVAYMGAMRFFGYKGEIDNLPTTPTDDAKRIEAATLILLGFHAATNNPRWSSHAMERMWENHLSTPGASVSDVYVALAQIFQRNRINLTAETITDNGTVLTGVVRRFIRDLVIQGNIATGHKFPHAAFRWGNREINWLNETIASDLQQSSSMLLAHVIRYSPINLPEGQISKIVAPLKGTEYFNEGLNLLDDEDDLEF